MSVAKKVLRFLKYYWVSLQSTKCKQQSSPHLLFQPPTFVQCLQSTVYCCYLASPVNNQHFIAIKIASWWVSTALWLTSNTFLRITQALWQLHSFNSRVEIATLSLRLSDYVTCIIYPDLIHAYTSFPFWTCSQELHSTSICTQEPLSSKLTI
jgi:hypothetical protein